MKNILFNSGKHKPLASLALLVLRVSFGLMIMYLSAFTAIMILGAGSYSLDKAISGK